MVRTDLVTREGWHVREFVVDIVAEPGSVDDGQSNANAVLLKL